MSAPTAGGGRAYAVRSRQERFRGTVFSVFTDQVTMPDSGRVAARDYIRHVGAVGVVALNERDQVIMIRQYRHPLGQVIWELPAGLVDVTGEDLPAAALRELAEEADLTAGRLDTLVDLHTSPGYSNELIRVFLARQLAPVPVEQRHQRHDEEADLVAEWLDLDEAVRLALAGQVTNAAAVAGLLAAARARDAGWSPLRPADAPLPTADRGRD